MPADTVTAESVFVDRADVIEAIALIEATSTFVNNVFGFEEETLAAARDVLRKRMLPVDEGDDEWWVNDPVEVDVTARAYKLEAEMLEQWSDYQGRVARGEHSQRIATCKAMAIRTRERGSTDLTFQLEEPPNA